MSSISTSSLGFDLLGSSNHVVQEEGASQGHHPRRQRRGQDQLDEPICMQLPTELHTEETNRYTGQQEVQC